MIVPMQKRRLWVTIVTSAVANALALGLAAWLLGGFSLNLLWWAVSCVLFTVLTVVLRTVVQRADSRWLRVYTITGGLAVTLAALALTDLIVPSDGFAIHGWSAWVGATLIVWASGIAFGEVDHHAPAATPGVSPEVRSSRRAA